MTRVRRFVADIRGRGRAATLQRRMVKLEQLLGRIQRDEDRALAKRVAEFTTRLAHQRQAWTTKLRNAKIAEDSERVAVAEAMLAAYEQLHGEMKELL